MWGFMDKLAFKMKSKIVGGLYRGVLRRALFLLDAEKVHTSFTFIGKTLGSNAITKAIVRWMFDYENEMLEQEILGVRFRNPIGLATGFDKNAELISIMGDVGFGFADIGSVTAKACKGNEGKRLWRHKDKKALQVYMGLNNRGAEALSRKLRGKKFGITYGVSVAKTNCKEVVEDVAMINDYLFTMQKFKDIGNYMIINISCPNAYGGLPFTEPRLFEMLMKRSVKIGIMKPIFIKMSPDLEKKTLDKIIAIARKYKIVNGFICSNLTKQHDYGKGGMSGKFVEKKANELLSYVHKKVGKEFMLIGVGGIFSAEDAYKKIKLGASLVQLITGMVYEGPSIIGEINCGLVKLLKRDGYTNISEAVGKGI